MKKNQRHLKVMSVLGTRPEIIRLSRILPIFDEYFNHKVVFTSQNFDRELSSVFFDEFELRKPDYVLDVKAETLGQQIGNILSQVELAFIKEKPNAVFILGDTNSSLSAIIAKRMRIPLFHMEAGNRSFDWNVPEEINRRIVDHISDFNLCYTEHSRRYLIGEGIHPGSLFVVGSPLAEVFAYFAEKIERSAILEELKLRPKKYFLLSVHREENIDDSKTLRELFIAAEYLAKKYDLPIVVSLHPRTKKRLKDIKLTFGDTIIFSKPFGFFAYNKLQKNAFCTLSDSGSVPEESAIFSFPAVQIRRSTERPEAYDKGVVTLTGFDKHTICTAVELTLYQFRQEKLTVPSDYLDKNVSVKVAKLVLGLTSIQREKNL